MGARAVILSGGPDSVYDPGARMVDPAILESELPILGICYGMQLFAHQMGGRVEMHTGRREYGPAEIHLTTDERAMGMAGSELPRHALRGRRDQRRGHARLDEPRRPHRRPAARFPRPGPHQLARWRPWATSAIGIQFHPEVIHTPQGAQIIANFLFRMCGCPGTGRRDPLSRRASSVIRAGRRRRARDLRSLRRRRYLRRRRRWSTGPWATG